MTVSIEFTKRRRMDSLPQRCTYTFNYDFLVQNSITTLLLPLFLPLFPLFPKCKMVIQGWYLDDADNIKCETTMVLKNLTLQNVEGYFQQWNWRRKYFPAEAILFLLSSFLMNSFWWLFCSESHLWCNRPPLPIIIV